MMIVIFIGKSPKHSFDGFLSQLGLAPVEPRRPGAADPHHPLRHLLDAARVA
jgi:hypothetical protein